MLSVDYSTDNIAFLLKARETDDERTVIAIGQKVFSRTAIQGI